MFPLLGFTRCNNFEAQCTPGLFKIVVQTLITLFIWASCAKKSINRTKVLLFSFEWNSNQLANVILLNVEIIKNCQCISIFKGPPNENCKINLEFPSHLQYYKSRPSVLILELEMSVLRIEKSNSFHRLKIKCFKTFSP